MRNHFIAIGLLAIVVIVTLIAGFYFTGSPIAQRGINYDNSRLTDFSNIKYAVENYYRDNKKLPDTLSDLKNANKIQDPETRKPYDYSVVSPTQYKLCATFSTDSEEVEKRLRANRTQRFNYYESNYLDERKHKKGYDCIEYKLADYLLKKTVPAIPTLAAKPFEPKVPLRTEASCKSSGGKWDYNSCKIQSCADSDNTYGANGINNSSINTKGTINYGSASVTDYCDNTTIVEYYCVDDTLAPEPGYYLSYFAQKCSKGCGDGACLM